jgi:uncharacterized protein
MESPIDGLGCFATVHFNRDGLIAEYAGERISYSEAMRRMRGAGGLCISQLDAYCYIDGSVGGNGTQFINHSCEPNADVLISEGLMFVFPIRDISPGDEITVDYLNSFEKDRTVCRCRTASCRNTGQRKTV